MTGAIGQAADVVIIGGGMAGLEVAGLLAETGVEDVLVLESGPQADSRHNNMALTNPDALRRWLAPETDPYFERRWVSRTPPHYTGPSGLRRRLGGRSLYWYGVCLPVDDWARADWPQDVMADLAVSWQGGPSLYDRTRAMLRRWSGGDDTPSRPDLHLGDLAFAPTPVAVRADGDRWRAYSPLDRWRDPEVGGAPTLPPGVRVALGADVRDVLLDAGGRAMGVRFASADGETEVRATSVVLAAGTLENTRLALQAVAAVDAGRRPVIGTLNDHVVQGFFLRVDEPALAAVQDRLPRGGRCSLGDGRSRSNVFVDVSAGNDGTGLVDVRATGEQLPDDACRVTLEHTAEGRRLEVFATPSARDRELIAAQRRTLAAVWADLAAILRLPEGRLDFGDFDSPARVNAFVLPETIDSAPTGTPLTWSSYLGVEDHEAGTLPLGSFLDLDHEVRQVPGLFVAGPSSFPRMGAANPSLTTLSLARRLAGVLAERRGAGVPAVSAEARA
ncbi:GMC family oxidoreductase [Xylanimonas oleitrophica]|uniref:GMC family oxidoreductase n=1 Tax=Xylanimonas oleitrophica TaxID=2607479 RepID=A0A2W5Y3I1_9MICO|nr:GMC oxidoreductase [Xylanimonas oleitrophica]PZR52364.1 GMC family oxidoreductase [Xylanimonas oleitrophica]